MKHQSNGVNLNGNNCGDSDRLSTKKTSQYGENESLYLHALTKCVKPNLIRFRKFAKPNLIRFRKFAKPNLIRFRKYHCDVF